MKIKIIRNTVAGGAPVFVGDVVELQEQEARYLVGIGKAAPADPPAAEAASPQMGEHHLGGEVETADLKPKFEKAVKPSAKKGA